MDLSAVTQATAEDRQAKVRTREQQRNWQMQQRPTRPRATDMVRVELDTESDHTVKTGRHRQFFTGAESPVLHRREQL